MNYEHYFQLDMMYHNNSMILFIVLIFLLIYFFQMLYDYSFNFMKISSLSFIFGNYKIHLYPIYQPLRSGRIWHKVNF